jgi:hypothetical protein
MKLLIVLWHIDPLLDNDHETKNETTAITMQHFHKYATVSESLLGSDWSTITEVLLEAVFSIDPLRGYVTWPTELSVDSEVQSSGASWLVSKLEDYCSEGFSWGTGRYLEYRGSWTSAVGSRYQATTCEDTAEWEDLVRAIVNCCVCELAIAL